MGLKRKRWEFIYNMLLRYSLGFLRKSSHKYIITHKQFQRKKQEQEEEKRQEETHIKTNVSISCHNLDYKFFILVNDTNKTKILHCILVPSINKNTRCCSHILFFDCVNCMFKNSLTVDYYLCNTAPPLKLI